MIGGAYHFKHVCSCGTVIAQCRCPGEKTVTVKPHGCTDCRIEKRKAESVAIDFSKVYWL